MNIRRKVRRMRCDASSRIDELTEQMVATADREERLRLGLDRLAIAVEHGFVTYYQIPKAAQKALDKGQRRVAERWSR